jgi:hypothetical protein
MIALLLAIAFRHRIRMDIAFIVAPIGGARGDR